MRTSWDERYAGEEYGFGTQPSDFLAQVAGEIPDGPVLCLAEGEGRNSVYLASLGHAVTGIDKSEVGIAKAVKLAAKRGVDVELIVKDLEKHHITPNSWAGIVSIFAHVPKSLRARLYKESAMGLLPGGVMIIEAYHPEQIGRGTGGPSDPSLMPTLADLQSELSGLEFEIGVERVRDVVEGKYHTGEAFVVQVLARKLPSAT